MKTDNTKEISLLDSNLEVVKDLTPQQQEHIAQAFSSHEMQLAGYKNSFNHIINQELTPELAKQARSMRLEVAKVRQASNKTHKVQKAFALAYGRLVDSKKNVIEDLAKSFEVPLQRIEDYEKIALEKKQAELQISRGTQLAKYTEDIPKDLGAMEAGMFDAILLGYEQKFLREQEAAKELARKEAEEAKKEAERLAAEKLYNARKLEVQKYSFVDDISKYNLSLQTSEAEYKAIIKRLEQVKVDHEEKQKALALHNERKDKLLAYWNFLTDFQRGMDFSTIEEKEFKDIGNYAYKLKVQHDKKEAEKLEIIKKAEEAEKLKAQEEAKIKIEAAKEKARLEKLAKAPEKERLLSWVNSFELPNIELKTDTANNISSKFDSFKEWAIKEINKI